jgi:hypothetical protein
LAPVGLVAAAALALAVVLAGPSSLRLPSQRASNVKSGAAAREQTAAPRQSPRTPAPAVSVPAFGAPSGAPQSPSAAAETAPSAGVPTCPTSEVSALVEQVTQAVEQSPPTSVGTQVTATLPPLMRTTVTGVLRNTSAAAVSVDPFPVDISFAGSPGASSTTVSVEALAAPVVVPAGGSVPWSASADSPPYDPRSARAEPRLGTWRWADAGLAAACPGPATASR